MTSDRGHGHRSFVQRVWGVLAALVLRLCLPGMAWPPLLATALAATALEQVSWGGLDNLTVPLASAWLAGQLG